MESSRACESCRKKTLAADHLSGYMVCQSCGLVQKFGSDNFVANIGGITGDKGTYVRHGSSTDHNYKETKIYHAQNSIADCVERLGLSHCKSEEVRSLIEQVTDGEYGQGEWFPVLVGACAYIVMRRDHNMLPMVKVADIIGCDAHELGRMISRVVDFNDLKLPEFDIVNAFESAITSFSSFATVSKDVKDRMLQQGVFLVQCLIKWFITTGRRPMPVVAAVLVFVAELNRVDVKMEDVAMQLLVATATCRLRYKELLQRLVEVAQALPWGKDVTMKNIMKYAGGVMKYMEMKSMTEKKQSIEHFDCDMEGLVTNCLSKEIGYDSSTQDYYSSKYFELDYMPNFPDKFKISHESLTMIYSNYLEEVEAARAEIDLVPKRKRRKVADVEAYSGWEWWEGKSAMSKKLILKKILKKDVGLDCTPPSFDRACISREKRQEKIRAAKMRIGRIMNPRTDSSELSLVVPGKSRKKQNKKKLSVDIDWEDLIIETLLLHSVKEEEIEKGHYNVLLELHVFGHGY